MCGRYATFLPPEAIVALFQTKGETPNWAPTWNMAPTRSAPVVRLHPESGQRRLDLLRWGLVPHWAKDPKAIRLTINARAETLATTPMFRDAFARGRRCLVPADAFYEWQTTSAGKIPHAIARADGQPLVFAGLWEGWRGPDGNVIRSFVIITTAANDALRPLHERMPVVLEAESWSAWLGDEAGDTAWKDTGNVISTVTEKTVSTDAGDVAALLRPSTAAFRVWPVGTSINHVRNDIAELLNPA